MVLLRLLNNALHGTLIWLLMRVLNEPFTYCNYYFYWPIGFGLSLLAKNRSSIATGSGGKNRGGGAGDRRGICADAHSQTNSTINGNRGPENAVGAVALCFVSWAGST